MFQMMADAGIGSLRCECLWGLCQRREGDSLSFGMFDKVCASAAAKGVLLKNAIPAFVKIVAQILHCHILAA